MKKSLSAVAAITLGLTALGATSAKAQDYNTCVTKGEFAAIALGSLKARTESMLDGAGVRLWKREVWNPDTRRFDATVARQYVPCWGAAGSTVTITYDDFTWAQQNGPGLRVKAKNARIVHPS